MQKKPQTSAAISMRGVSIGNFRSYLWTVRILITFNNAKWNKSDFIRELVFEGNLEGAYCVDRGQPIANIN